MKKLILLLVLAMALSVVGVMGVTTDTDDQNTGVVVEEVIDISVNDLAFGSVTPGELAGPQTSTITLEANNNQDLTVTLEVTNTGSGGLFSHLIFDLNGNTASDDGEIDATTPSVDILDSAGSLNMDVWLNVPVGFVSGINNGVVQYTAAKDITV